MKDLNRTNYPTSARPIRVLQFGEGNFLRAFVDWILQEMNDKALLHTDVVVVQPRPCGRVEALSAQDGLYTLCLEGMENGEIVEQSRIIDVLRDFVNPYTDYEKFLRYAASPELELIVSNTTEAGIALDPSDTDFSVCPESFPGKLLAFLKARFDAFAGDETKGLAIVPCELIDHNGDELRRVLNELAKCCHMPEAFLQWLNTANHFTNTLVDRIVPGYPKDTAEAVCARTGFQDNSIVKGEVFHLWVLQKEPFVQEKLPADKAGLHVIYADDITPYKQRKVRILNGAHTAMVPVAYLCGIDTVREAVTDADVGAFVRKLTDSEIKPTIDLPKAETDAFAASVMDRFRNPFIRHELMAIALNSTTKFRTRLLPTYEDYLALYGTAPNYILFALAALAVFYRGRRGEETIALADDAAYLQFWEKLWRKDDIADIAASLLSAKALWQQDLYTPETAQLLTAYLLDITQHGMRQALQAVLRENP